ncbi:MAG: hypothetical protein OJF59_003148 [Cytophagales bacterium]|nr:MAG: hypothetical protein OJF59_003148 [Cytophagales bacterium]
MAFSKIEERNPIFRFLSSIFEKIKQFGFIAFLKTSHVKIVMVLVQYQQK